MFVALAAVKKLRCVDGCLNAAVKFHAQHDTCFTQLLGARMCDAYMTYSDVMDMTPHFKCKH